MNKLKTFEQFDIKPHPTMCVALNLKVIDGLIISFTPIYPVRTSNFIQDGSPDVIQGSKKDLSENELSIKKLSEYFENKFNSLKKGLGDGISIGVLYYLDDLGYEFKIKSWGDTVENILFFYTKGEIDTFLEDFEKFYNK